jgi:hypothetical protein
VSVLDELMRGWLRRVARSRHRERLVLRGSLLTQSWCAAADPGVVRAPVDVDHTMLGTFDAVEVRAMVDELLSAPDEPSTFDPGSVTHEVIWAETAFPGLRTTVLGMTRSGTALLKIDLGVGDPLAVAPTWTSAFGEPPVLGVRPETMFAWKTHGLFEFGHGVWRAKDLYDLWLLGRYVSLEPMALEASVRVAFESRAAPLSLADRFLFTTDWGASGGSRRRWKSFARKAGLLASAPAIGDAIAEVRRRLLPVFAALGHRAPSSA